MIFSQVFPMKLLTEKRLNYDGNQTYPQNTRYYYDYYYIFQQ